MTNNDILRRIRYVFDFNDGKMMAVFALAGCRVTRSQVSNWLKKDNDPEYQKCGNTDLAVFLNGLIIEKRGRKEGPLPQPEVWLTNNMIFRKLRIALALESDDILDILALAGHSASEHEISAFFRKPGNRHYRECKDQVLRKFLKGLQLKYRPGI